MFLDQRLKRFVLTYLPKLLLILIVLGLCISVGINVFYLLHDLGYLKNWFFGLNDCFYRREYWANDFFTPQVKTEGNKFAACGLILSVSGIIYALANCKRYWNIRPYGNDDLTWQNRRWHIAIFIGATCLWCWGYKISATSYDEAFSGVNCSELPVFQNIAYYMLPNNHVYFNVFNHLLFGWYGDPVVSGRFVSFFAYLIMLFIVFSWFVKITGNKLWSLLALIPVSLQLMAWGFGFQARGYEWLLCSSWIAFVSLFRYIDKGDRNALKLNTIFCVIGFMMIPIYLYYFLSQALFMLLLMSYKKRVDFKFVKYQFFCIAIVFLCYLPTICFSGLHALLGNPYVRAEVPEVSTYVSGYYPVIKYFMDCVYGQLFGEDKVLNYVVLALPLFLFLSKDIKKRRYALFFFLQWLCLAIINISMRSTPPARTAIFIFSISVAMTLYTLYELSLYLASQMPEKFREGFMWSFAGILICLLSVHLFVTDCKTVVYKLYDNTANTIYDNIMKDIDHIPARSSVAFSDESFAVYYYCRKRHYQVSRCPVGNEAYYVSNNQEKIPDYITNYYVLILKGEENFDIYKKK